MSSPSGDSILITSAPSPARIWVANGPRMTVVRSRTRTPASGPAMLPRLHRSASWLCLASSLIGSRLQPGVLGLVLLSCIGANFLHTHSPGPSGDDPGPKDTGSGGYATR